MLPQCFTRSGHLSFARKLASPTSEPHKETDSWNVAPEDKEECVAGTNPLSLANDKNFQHLLHCKSGLTTEQSQLENTTPRTN